MRVLITGVCGFVGRRLAHHMLSRGDVVWGADVSRGQGLESVDLCEVDLLDAEAVAEVVERSEADVVVHLAGMSHVGDSWKAPGTYFQVNVLGTENLLRASSGKRVLLASSAEVYGLVPEDEQPIREDRQPAPQSPYALTKAAAERLALCHGAIVVRSFNIVGGGQSPTFALPAFAGQLATISRGGEEPVIRVGNLAARRDFIHVDDAVSAFRSLAERGEPGGIYNLGSGQACTIGELLERLRAVSGVEARVEIDPERFRPVDLPLLVADTGRLRALGWLPSKTLDDAVADLWASTLDSEPA